MNDKMTKRGYMVTTAAITVSPESSLTQLGDSVGATLHRVREENEQVRHLPQTVIAVGGATVQIDRGQTLLLFITTADEDETH